MGPIVFILVFLIVPLAAGLFLLAFVLAMLVAKAVAALPLAVWGLIVALALPAALVWRRSGRRRERGAEMV